MKPVLGLDFGTTKSVAAWVNPDGRLQFAAVDEGVYELPSVASYQDKRGATVLGDTARRMFTIDPKRTVVGVKRFLGRRFQSDFVGRARQRFSFPLVEAMDGLTAVEVRGEPMALDQAAARLIGEIVECANRGLGERFETVVLSVPVHFHQRQRRALKRAVERCGLEVQAMILEPTAAALTLPEPDQARTLLVYDFGGGTFDTTVLKIESGLVHVLAAHGDAFLGGFELDVRIADEIAEQFRQGYGVDLQQNKLAMQALVDGVEAGKIELSTSESTHLHVPFIDDKQGMGRVECDLSRADLERVTAPLIEKTIGIAQEALAQAKVPMSAIDDVIAVGSQTRMPYVRRRLEEAFGRPPRADVDPTRCVAMGAAIYASGEHMLMDALGMPICLAVPRAAPVELFARNQRIPAHAELPIADANPVAGIVYEAPEVAAIDRDVLGKLVVAKDWRDAHAGPYTLKADLNAAFEIEFAVSAPDGAELEVALDEGSKAAPPSSIDLEVECEVAALVLVRPSEQTKQMKAVRMGPGTVLIESKEDIGVPSGATAIVKLRLGRDVAEIEGPVQREAEPTKFRVRFAEGNAGVLKMLAFLGAD